MIDNEPLPVPATSSSRGRGMGVVLLLLALSAALGYGGWRLWQWLEATTETLEAEDALIRRLSQQLRTLEADSDHLARRLEDSEGAQARQAEVVAGLQSQQDGTSQAMAALEATLKGGRTRFQLAAVEELLLLAHDRVALAADVGSAVTALELADARLAALSDPRLLGVRETLGRERLALLSAGRPDLSGAALALASLLERAGSLPLASRIPRPGDASPSQPVEEPLAADAEWPLRLAARMRSALQAVFRIQRESRPVDRLLPPEQEALIHTLLALKLEGARLALLRQDANSYRDLLSGARDWLAQYYVEGDARVMAAQAELERLRTLEIRPTLPVPQKALEQLRAVGALR
jgi:uncharacterized protein HemX